MEAKIRKTLNGWRLTLTDSTGASVSYILKSKHKGGASTIDDVFGFIREALDDTPRETPPPKGAA